MSTTIDTITDDQIRTLRDEAHAAGDVNQVAICNTALAERDYSAETIERARTVCARVIAEAEAQAAE